MKLGILLNSAEVGAEITLRLNKGEDLSGRIIELTSTYIVIEDDHRRSTIFEDLLAGWEITPSKQKPPSLRALSEQPLNLQQNTTVTPTPKPSAPQQITTELMARVESDFSQRTLSSRLATPTPSFDFIGSHYPDSTRAEINSEWIRAKNKYEYALKVREPSRILDLLAQILSPLCNKFPNMPDIMYLRGCLELEAGKKTDGLKSLMSAASISDTPRYWRAASAAALIASDEKQAYVALKKLFFILPPDRELDEWFVFLGLTINLGAYSDFLDVAAKYSSHEFQSPVVQLLGESALFILMMLARKTEALSIATALTGEEISTQDLLGELQSVPSALTQSSQPKILDILVPSEPASPASTAVVAPEIRDQNSGRIMRFGSQGFGFIQAIDGRHLFFRSDDVVDELLRQQLSRSPSTKDLKVVFKEVPSPGHKYSRAVAVALFQRVDELVAGAIRAANTGQHLQGLSLVQLALSLETNNSDALALESRLKKELGLQKATGIGLPKGEGPYAKAKRSQLVDLDLERAEEFYRAAIRQKDKTISAVKDLASLLQQQGRAAEAISLLQSYRNLGDTASFDNILATFYAHGGDYEKAIDILTRLARAASRQARPVVLRRLAWAQYQAKSYEAAEKTLREILQLRPDDQTTGRWLAALEEARQLGTYEEADEKLAAFGNLADFTIQLSILATGMLERCNFEGVAPAKLKSGTVSKRDVEMLEELAKQLGTKRPRDRAAYYLSAAAILRKFELDDDDTKARDYLRRYFVSMGDAARADRKHPDVVRAFYAESLALANEAGHEVLYTLEQYFMSYLGPEAKGSLARGGLSKLLSLMASQDKDNVEKIIRVALHLSVQSGLASRLIWPALASDQLLLQGVAGAFGLEEEFFQDRLAIEWERQRRELAAERRQMSASCAVLTKFKLTTASMEDFLKQLSTLKDTLLCDLDQQRLTSLRQIALDALNFCAAGDFEERERHYYLVSLRADQLTLEIDDSPTRISFESLRPLAGHLRSLVEEQYAELALTSSPDLTIELLIDSYVPSRSSEVRLQIGISNRSGCSPASNIELQIGPENSIYFDPTLGLKPLAGSLRGGASLVEHLQIKVSEAARIEEAFPITIVTRFRDRLGEEGSTHPIQLTVRLYSESDFSDIENSYAPFSEGGPVDDPGMFFGRNELIEQISSSLLSAAGSKCVVLYGQKRAGKSSLLEHLKRRLSKAQCLPVFFSLQEIATEVSEGAFLYRILTGIQEALVDKGLQMMPELPSLKDFTPHCSLNFHEILRLFLRRCREQDSEIPRIILLVDEFTDIYKQINRGKMAREFMKAWKAIIEKRYFSSVLVGQDIMPSFKMAFPNEFGVTEDQRITYLSERDVRDLIETPIGHDRYRGRAVARIVELTAGSPYYTMMLCSRLVDYMNRTKSAVVTEADIDAVKEGMIRGHNPLTRDKFDNLLAAGDGKEDSGIDPAESLAACLTIARKAENGWCHIRKIEEAGSDWKHVIFDLENRDVVERRQDSYRLVVGLFAEWLVYKG